MTVNDLVMREMVVSENTSETADAMYGFINSWSDQANWTEITTYNEEWYHLFNDPRDKNEKVLTEVEHDSFRGGMGLMSRFTASGGPAVLLTGPS